GRDRLAGREVWGKSRSHEVTELGSGKLEVGSRNGENPLMARVESEYTLLCEGCGYVVEGLPEDGPCPECGKGMAESLARPGSAWQRQRSVRAWWRTVWATLRSPRRLMGEIQIETRHSSSLLWLNTVVAGGVLLIAAPIIVAVSISEGGFARLVAAA